MSAVLGESIEEITDRAGIDTRYDSCRLADARPSLEFLFGDLGGGFAGWADRLKRRTDGQIVRHSVAFTTREVS